MLEHLRAVSGAELPIVAIEYDLGSSGIRADVAVFADEYIGVLIKVAADTLKEISAEYQTVSRYFDRTILLVAPDHLESFDIAAVPGAAIWTIGVNGEFVEIDAGEANTIGLSAYFELLSVDEKRRLLEPLRVHAPVWARGEAPISIAQAREHFGAAIVARYATASENFWTPVSGRSVAPEDLARLHSRTFSQELDRVRAA